MSQISKQNKQYAQMVGCVFLFVMILHAARLAFALDARIDGIWVPQWVSMIVVLGSGYLAYKGLKLGS